MPARLRRGVPLVATLTFGLHRGRGVVSRLIQLQTRSPFSHVSIVLADGTLLEAKEGRGVIDTRRLAEVQRAETVELVTVPCRDVVARAAAIAFAHAQLGKRYDYTSVLRFLSRRQARRKDAEVWFCSELAFAVAQAAGVTLLRDTEPWEVSPGLFARSPLLERGPDALMGDLGAPIPAALHARAWAPTQIGASLTPAFA